MLDRELVDCIISFAATDTFSICRPRLGLSVMAMHHYALEMEGAEVHRK